MKVFRYIVLILLGYSLPLIAYGEVQDGHGTNYLQGMTVFKNGNGDFQVKMEFENLPDKQYNLKPIGKNTYILPLPYKNGEQAQFTYVGNNTYIMLLPNSRASISENDIVYESGKENINVSMQENQDLANPDKINTKIIFQTKDNSTVKVSAYPSSTGEQKPENTENNNNQENLENAQSEQNEQNEIKNNDDNITENTDNNQNNYSRYSESNSRTLSPFDWFCYILTLILGIICLYLIRKQTSATKKKKNKKKHRKSAAVKISTYDEDISVTVRNNFYKDITPPSETYAFDKEDEGKLTKSTNTSQPISYDTTPSYSTTSKPTEQTESSLLVLDPLKTETMTNNSNSYQTQEEKEEDVSFFDIENQNEILPDVGVEALPPSEDDPNNDLTFFELEDEKIDINNEDDLQIEINDTSNFNNYDFSLIDIDDENISSTVIEEEPQNIENKPNETDEFTLLDEEEESSINEQTSANYKSLTSNQNEEITILEDSDSDIIFEDNNEDLYTQQNDIPQNSINDKDVVTDSNINFDIYEEFTIIDDTEDNDDIVIEEPNNIPYKQVVSPQSFDETEEVIFTNNEYEISNEDISIINDTKNDIINDMASNIEEQTENIEFISEPVQNEENTFNKNSADIEKEEGNVVDTIDKINLYQRNLQYIKEIGNIKTEQLQKQESKSNDTLIFTETKTEAEKVKEEDTENLIFHVKTDSDEKKAEEIEKTTISAEIETAEYKEKNKIEILPEENKNIIIYENQEQPKKEKELKQENNLSDAYKKALASAHNEKEEKQPEIIEDFKMNDSNKFCLMKYGSKVSIVGNIDNKVFVLKTFNPEQIGSEHLFMEFCTKSNTSSIYSIILNNFKALVKVTDKEISLIGEYN